MNFQKRFYCQQQDVSYNDESYAPKRRKAGFFTYVSSQRLSNSEINFSIKTSWLLIRIGSEQNQKTGINEYLILTHIIISVEMALVNSQVQVTFEQVYKRDEKDNIIETKKVKLIKRIYPCRPQVNQRRNWVKFGQVSGIPRGTHKKGDFTQTENPVLFETDQGNVEDQLEMVKQIKNISKESMMMKQLRSGK